MVDTDAFPGDTLDCNPDLNPTYCTNAETCTDVPLDAYDFVLADPPYSKEHAARYGTALPNSRKVMATLAARMQPGTLVLWLDQRKPQYRNAQWHRWVAIASQAARTTVSARSTDSLSVTNCPVTS